MKQRIASGLLGLGLLLELGATTWWKDDANVYLNPILWLVGGLLVAIGGFHLLRVRTTGDTRPNGKIQPQAQNRSSPPPLPPPSPPFAPYPLLLFLALVAYSAYRMAGIFADFEPGPLASDIYPSLQFYVQRLLSGETVYAPMEFPGWTVLPTYFPMMWLPYVPAEVLHFDYRWCAFGAFVIVWGIYVWRLRKGTLSLPGRLLLTAFPFLVLLSYFTCERQAFGFAVELMPTAFYLLLCLTIWHRKPWVMALGIIPCLLSRYGFTFWLPLYFVIIWIERGFPTVLRTGLVVALGVLLLYVLPFLSKDWSILTDGLAYYQKTAVGQWYPQGWQTDGEPPAHLYRGLSLAPYFYDDVALTVEDRLARNQKWHLAASAFAALLLFAGYLYGRRRTWPVRAYLLCGLKFYLIIFYSFLYVPFAYLYMLPLLLSMAILYELGGMDLRGRAFG